MSSLREQLEAVRKKAKVLTPETVVAAATPEDHPLHSRFEWNDTIAGHKYRLEQARHLIKEVKVTYTDPKGQPQEVRAFQAVRVDATPTFVYEPSEKVASDPVLREIVLMDMKREWKALQSRYGHFAEFVQMIQEDIA